MSGGALPVAFDLEPSGQSSIISNAGPSTSTGGYTSRRRNESNGNIGPSSNPEGSTNDLINVSQIQNTLQNLFRKFRNNVKTVQNVQYRARIEVAKALGD